MITFALGLLLAAAPAGDTDATAVLKALETAGRGLKTMKAAFVETKVLTLLNEKQETRGNVTLQIPGRMRMPGHHARKATGLARSTTTGSARRTLRAWSSRARGLGSYSPLKGQ